MSNPIQPAPDFADAEALAAITQLIAEYQDAVDCGDSERIVAVLAHATIIGPTGKTIEGADAIRGMYTGANKPGDDGRRKTKHYLTNVRVHPVDADGVHEVDSYYLMFVPGEGGPSIRTSGRYHHRVARRDGRWVVLLHQIIHDL